MDPDMSLLQTLIYLYTWVLPLRNIFVGCASHIDGWLYLEELNQKGLYSCLHWPRPVDGFDRTLFHHPLKSCFYRTVTFQKSCILLTCNCCEKRSLKMLRLKPLAPSKTF